MLRKEASGMPLSGLAGYLIKLEKLIVSGAIQAPCLALAWKHAFLPSKIAKEAKIYLKFLARTPSEFIK